MVRIGAICHQCRKYYRGESCPKCSTTAKWSSRLGQQYEGEGYWDHGLGQQITSRSQRSKIMNEKNLVEIGTEPYQPERVHAAQARQKKAMLEQCNKEAVALLRRGAPQWN